MVEKVNLLAQFQEFMNRIRPKQRFLLSCHVHPDGDGIGSLLALGLALESIGKDVRMVSSDGVPGVYNYLECSPAIIKDLAGDFQPEILICLDCSEKERVALPAAVWDSPGLIVINIDHHLTNLGFGDLNLIEPNAAATGEIILHLLQAVEIPLNRAIAMALYTAIATDTGFFRFANTTADTLEACTYLVKNYRIEPSKIAEQVHEQKSYNSIRLLGEVLSTIRLEHGGKTAWAILDQQMLTKYSVENEETESYVNYARSIEGVEIGILFKELKPNEIKLSWRSTAAVDVSKLAAYFGGGGHARAAGCSLNGPLPEIIREVLNFVGNYYGAN
ncbi:MAG TPA: bifunctional oligoribonuclease/PAP phosphatase NrnA [Bacillota bacterium]